MFGPFLADLCRGRETIFLTIEPFESDEVRIAQRFGGMFGKLPDRLNEAAKRPFEYAVIPLVREFDPQFLRCLSLGAIP